MMACAHHINDPLGFTNHVDGYMAIQTSGQDFI